MKKFLIALVIFLGLIACVRNIWYYPAYKRSPILKNVSKKPLLLSDITITSDQPAKCRYLLIQKDKYSSFPDEKHPKWSKWSNEHELLINKNPGWVKVFIQEKWLIFRKRSYHLFYNAGEAIGTFQNLYQQRFIHNTRMLDKRYNILCIGDSLTSGLFTTSEGNGFAAIIEKETAKLNGMSTVSSASIALDGLSKEYEQDFYNKLRQPLNIVIIELGTNDYGSVLLEKFEKNYNKMIKNVSKKTSAQIICVGLWREFNSYGYDKIISKIAEKNNAKFVYIADIFEDKSTHSINGAVTPFGKADDFHPNDKGHKEIAKRIINAIAATEKSF